MGPAIAAWVVYDWAYGAFTTVVSTFVFAAYFTQAVAPDPVSGASLWALGQALAGLVVAVVAVPLGAIADRGGRRRSLLAAASAVMVVCMAGLWFARRHHGDVVLALLLVGVATVAFEVATVFYNAMLPGLVRPARLGRLSMLAWGAGYGGGLCCLALCLVLLVMPNPAPFGLDRSQAEPVRATALLAAGWLAVFGWPVCVFVPDHGPRRPWRVALAQGMAELRHVLAAVLQAPALGRFLLARLFFMDGLTTLFAFGGIYAAGAFGLDAQQVLIFGIGLNVTAGLGALGFAFVEDRLGAKRTVLLSLAGLVGFGLAVLLVRDVAWFWGLGLALGLFVGPCQAASRSMMAQMAPAEQLGGYFGLFALSGRVTGFLGPAALSLVTFLFHSQRAGMAVIVVLLALGGVLLTRVAYQAPISERRARSTT
jgi:UMF1 family MFS transporter